MMETRMYKEVICKEFPIEGTQYTISRGDYEGLPLAMKAWDWSDEKMQELADNISARFAPTDQDDALFWELMESEAVSMGMVYYDDMSDEEFNADKEKYNKTIIKI